MYVGLSTAYYKISVLIQIKYHKCMLINIYLGPNKVSFNRIFKWAFPGLFFIYFCTFKQTLHFLQQINVKNFHRVYDAGIWTHNLWTTSLLPNHYTSLFCCSHENFSSKSRSHFAAAFAKLNSASKLIDVQEASS